MARDFFDYLADRPDQDYYAALGSGQRVQVKKKFQKKARKAFDLCETAIAAEGQKGAYKKWRNVFGRAYPSDEAVGVKKAAYIVEGASQALDTEEFIEDRFTVDMGVGQTSLYLAFGDKASLYLAAIKRFEESYGVLNMNRIEASASLPAAIATLLEDAISRYTAPRHPLGCMILSGRVCDKPSQRKLLLKLRERRSRQGTAISHAMRGFSDITDSTFLSQYLLSQLIGLSTLACDGVPASILRKSIPLVTAGALAAATP